MKIITLELKGYNRVTLRGATYLKFTPKSILQLILGSNGSGKSSLIKELFPLPGLHKEFEKDGFKSIEITNRGHHYLCQSIFSPDGHKYHFIKDGVELNEGFTISTYYDLVRLEFGITREIVEFLLGENAFTDMGPIERRTSLMAVADADYSYAIRYFKNLSGRLKGTTEAIKVIKNKLQAETSKKLSEAEEKNIALEVESLREQMNSVISMRPRSYENSRNVEGQLDSSLEALSVLVDMGEKLKLALQENKTFKSKEDAQKRLLGFQRLESSSESIYTYLGEKLRVKQQQMEEAKALAGKDLNKYLDDRVELRKTLTTLQSQCKFIEFDRFEDPSKILDLFHSCRESYSRLVSELTPNPHSEEENRRLYSTSRLNETRAILLATEEKHKAATTRLANVVVKIDEQEHLQTHTDTECPSCNHRWKLGFSKVKLEALLKEKEELDTEVSNLRLAIGPLKDTINEIETYFRNYLAYKKFVDGYTSLSLIWEVIEATGIIFQNPQSIAATLETVYSDIELRVMIKQTFIDLEENQKWTVALEAQRNSDGSEDSDYSDMENHFWEKGQELRHLRSQISAAQRYISLCEDAERLEIGLKNQLHTHSNHVEKINDSIFSDFLNDVYLNLNAKLAEKQQLLTGMNIHNGIIQSMKGQLEDLEKERYLLDLAVKELSPTSGLIARGLTGFINHFLLQMNSFTKKIWTYPMEICLVNMSEDDVDLDYKFKVRINDNREIPDISKGSAGQKQIINLAYRVVAMSYMKMSEYPLFLDEFGSGFDAGHRHMAFHVITTLIATSGFSQVFIISHDESSYGSLHNCDISVLCDANVVVPEGAITNRELLLR